MRPWRSRDWGLANAIIVSVNPWKCGEEGEEEAAQEEIFALQFAASAKEEKAIGMVPMDGSGLE